MIEKLGRNLREIQGFRPDLRPQVETLHTRTDTGPDTREQFFFRHI